MRTVFVGIEQKVSTNESSIFLKKDQLSDLSGQGNQRVIFGAEGGSFIEGDNNVTIGKEDRVELGSKVTLASLVDNENGRQG